jgi:hypothetical protein
VMGVEGHGRKVFQDAFLYLLEAVMVFVEHFAHRANAMPRREGERASLLLRPFGFSPSDGLPKAGPVIILPKEAK